MENYVLLAEADWLRWFVTDTQIPGWETVATGWIAGILVMSVLVALFASLIKYWYRRSARNLLAFHWVENRRGLTWTPQPTLLLVSFGFLPILLFLFVIWVSSRDFRNVVGIPGLLLGMVCCCLLYAIIILAIHLAPSWRRHLYPF